MKSANFYVKMLIRIAIYAILGKDFALLWTCAKLLWKFAVDNGWIKPKNTFGWKLVNLVVNNNGVHKVVKKVFCYLFGDGNLSWLKHLKSIFFDS